MLFPTLSIQQFVYVRLSRTSTLYDSYAPLIPRHFININLTVTVGSKIVFVFCESYRRSEGIECDYQYSGTNGGEQERV
jgi:hypothetical protein